LRSTALLATFLETTTATLLAEPPLNTASEKCEDFNERPFCRASLKSALETRFERENTDLNRETATAFGAAAFDSIAAKTGGGAG
jgi:hypothetical protein